MNSFKDRVMPWVVFGVLADIGIGIAVFVVSTMDGTPSPTPNPRPLSTTVALWALVALAPPTLGFLYGSLAWFADLGPKCRTCGRRMQLVRSGGGVGLVVKNYECSHGQSEGVSRTRAV